MRYRHTRLCLQPLAILIPTATGVLVLRHTEGTAAWAGYTLNMIQFVTKAIYEFIMHAGKIDVALVTVERLEECKCISSQFSPCLDHGSIL
jgi:hypothetical protein